MNAASITMGVAQSYRNDRYELAKAQLNANTLETQAARKELEAEEALAIGRLNQTEQVIKGRQEVAGQRVSYAASGVKVNEGSVVDVAANTAAWSEYHRQRLQYEAGLESWGLQYDALLLRQEAANVRAGAGTSSSGLIAAVGAGSQFLSILKKEYDEEIT